MIQPLSQRGGSVDDSKDLSLDRFLGTVDDLLRGALLEPLRAQEILQLLRSCQPVKRAICGCRSGRDTVCCPHIWPQNNAAFTGSLVQCDAAHLRTLRTAGHLVVDTVEGLAVLTERLGQCVGLRELGPITLDLSTLGAPPPRKWIPELLDGLAKCSSLIQLDLRFDGVQLPTANALAEAFPRALGGCVCLRGLRLDLDSTLPTSNVLMLMLGAALGELARAQHKIDGPCCFERLSLGYVWWTEPRDAALDALSESLARFCGTVRVLEVRCPQDPEFGALDVFVQYALRAVVASVEEVRIFDGWGTNDGCGLVAVADALRDCPMLRLVELEGVPPLEFTDNTRTFAQLCREKRSGCAPAELRWRDPWIPDSDLHVYEI